MPRYTLVSDVSEVDERRTVQVDALGSDEAREWAEAAGVVDPVVQSVSAIGDGGRKSSTLLSRKSPHVLARTGGDRQLLLEVGGITGSWKLKLPWSGHALAVTANGRLAGSMWLYSETEEFYASPASAPGLPAVWYVMHYGSFALHLLLSAKGWPEMVKEIQDVERKSKTASYQQILTWMCDERNAANYMKILLAIGNEEAQVEMDDFLEKGCR